MTLLAPTREQTPSQVRQKPNKTPPLVVLKFGSSVLRGPNDLPAAVSEIYRHVRQGRRVIAVVSAFDGLTDRLLAEAEAAGAPHDNVNAPAYVALGEETSATLLGLACDKAGLCALALKAPEVGIIAAGPALDAAPIGFNDASIRHALRAFDVVIAPGFVGADEAGRTVLLGRGGSDLTAIFLGRHLGAERVRLIKDVDGVYDADPARVAGAQRFARIDWTHAREIAGKLVQAKAIEFAATVSLPVEVGALGAKDATIIANDGDIPSRPRPRRRLRIALAGLGVVGAGVAQRVLERADLFELTGVLVRHRARTRDINLGGIELLTSPDALFATAPDCLIEVLSDGAAGLALIERALASGVHVISANKQAIAAGYTTLAKLQKPRGPSLRYAAAVGGSAPILEALAQARDEHAEIQSVEGVLNGTVNFVLERLARGLDLAEALRAARSAGLAEEDASLDLNGGDAAAKLRLIAQEAFGAQLSESDLHVEALDDAVAQRAGALQLRQISRVASRNGRLTAEIVYEPAHHTHFAELGGDRNGVLIRAHDGRQWHARGRGAGRWPTTESVLADLTDLASEIS